MRMSFRQPQTFLNGTSNGRLEMSTQAIKLSIQSKILLSSYIAKEVYLTLFTPCVRVHSLLLNPETLTCTCIRAPLLGLRSMKPEQYHPSTSEVTSTSIFWEGNFCALFCIISEVWQQGWKVLQSRPKHRRVPP